MVTPYWTSPFTVTDLVDWGIIPTMIEGQSRTSGKLLVREITPDTAAFFPKDWKGVCTVHEEITKVYMIR